MNPQSEVTAVRTRSAPEERTLLAALLAAHYGSILVVSDLHLGEGRDPDTGLYRLAENFTADGAFRRFLGCQGGDGNARLLVLLGDTFDFLRIPRVPERDPEYAKWRAWLERLGEAQRASQLPRPIRGVEGRFGLRTQDWKTVWKLLLILDGHPEFLAALVGWLGSGGRIVIAQGNHDVELHWTLVRRALRDALATAGAAPAHVEERLAFADGGFVVGDLYFEHGHQYEGMTRVSGPPVLPGRSAEINLPLGSFVNRYFVNRIERLDPFVDNRKPVQQALLALLRRRPLEILRVYWDGLRFIGKALTQARTRHGLGAIGTVALFYVPLLVIPLAVVWWLWPGGRSRVLAWLPFLRPGWVQGVGLVGGSLSPILAPYALGFLRELGCQVGLLGGRDALAEGAEERLRERFPGRPWARSIYAVMGHTHRQTVMRLPAIAGRAYYVNTGTWIPLWPSDRPDLAGRVIYSVTRFTRGDGVPWSHEALEWNDDAGELRPAGILSTPE